jgi:hypothetical protein
MLLFESIKIENIEVLHNLIISRDYYKTHVKIPLASGSRISVRKYLSPSVVTFCRIQSASIRSRRTTNQTPKNYIDINILIILNKY